VSPEIAQVLQVIGYILGGLLLTITGGVGLRRLRSGKPVDDGQPPQLAPARQPLPSAPSLQGYPAAPPAGLVDPAGDTGRHDVSWMSDTQRNLQAPPMSAAELRQMAANLETVAKQQPATLGALEAGLGTVGERIDALSDTVASVRESMLDLPCKTSPDDGCDFVEVPVPVPHPPRPHLKRVNP